MPGETQTAPATGAKLDRAAAEALIARRLVALGHPPGLLDASAIGALVDDAGGSGRRLRTSLAAALFLASTEDATSIDSGLVRRALSNEPAPPRTAVANRVERPARFTQSRALLAFSVSALALSLAVLILHPPQKDTPARPQPAQPQFSQPQSSQPQLAAQPDGPPAPPKPAAVANLPPVPPPHAPATPAPLPAPAEVAAPPAPPEAVADSTTPPPASQAVPPAVLLLYPAHSPGALNRLRPLALQLQRAGFSNIRAKPVTAPPARRPILYFYTDDQPSADLIAKALASAHWPKLDGTMLQPSLVMLPPGLPARTPGTIEVQLP